MDLTLNDDFCEYIVGRIEKSGQRPHDKLKTSLPDMVRAAVSSDFDQVKRSFNILKPSTKEFGPFRHVKDNKKYGFKDERITVEG